MMLQKHILTLLILFFALHFISVEARAETLSSGTAQKLSYRYGQSRSGYSTAKLSPNLSIKWFINTRLTDKYIFAPKMTNPLVGEAGILYFGDLEGNFCAFDISKKKIIWRQKTIGHVQAGATISDDNIYFGDNKGYLYSLNKKSGEVLWRQKYNVEILSAPLVIENEIYFTDLSDTLFCVSKDSGKRLWKVKLDTFTRDIIVRDVAAPAYSDGKLYQGFSDGYLYCFDTKTRKNLYKKMVGGIEGINDVDTPAAVDGDTLYASSFDGNFIAIKTANAKTKWKIMLDGSGYPGFNDNDLIIASRGGTLYNVDKSFGNIIWETKLSPNLIAPVITDKYVFAASEDYLYVVDIKSGKVLFEFEPGSGINSEIYLTDDALYFLSNKGYLYCFMAE